MLFQLFIANLTISFLLALFVYTNSKIYYKPCKLIDKNGNVVDIPLQIYNFIFYRDFHEISPPISELFLSEFRN